MKKYIVSLAAFACITLCSYAQSDSTRTAAQLRLDEIEKLKVEAKHRKSVQSSDKIFEADILSRFYFGRNYVKGDEFRGKDDFSYEIGFNAFQLGLNPTEWLTLATGLDLKWNRFETHSMQIVVDDGEFAFAAVVPDGIESKLCTFNLSVPAFAKFNFGCCSISLGAEGTFNIADYNRAKSWYTAGGSDFRQITKGGKVEKFRMSYFAALDFSGFGVYYKISPGSVVQGSDMIERYSTFGFFFSF